MSLFVESTGRVNSFFRDFLGLCIYELPTNSALNLSVGIILHLSNEG